MNQKDIEIDLKTLGLNTGDTVLLHSSLSSLGHIEGGANTVLNAFFSVLGPEGTLIAPTFGSLGILPDTLKQHPGAISSIHPRASVVAVGARAKEICRDHWKAETAHTENTPYMRIADLGGHICLLGVDQDRNTTLHAVEALLRLPYLKTTPEIAFSTPEGNTTRSWPFFPGPHRNFIGLDRLLQERDILHVGRIGNAVARLIKSRDMINTLLEVGRNNPSFVLCDNPNCADCVRQRADLRRDRFARETCTLATSANLAGRYIPEILETCQAAGITAIELDTVQGNPVQTLPAERLVDAVAELRTGGCTVTSLRASAVSEAAEPLLQTAASCAIPRVLFPLTTEAPRLTRAAAEAGVTISFYNTHLGSANVYESMSELTQQGLQANLTFSPAGFARAGEKPFLTSYSTKLKRFTDQLYVEDCTFDGTPTPLAKGNAEIKELVSILRCSSFNGFLVLGAGNRFTGTLADATAQFLDLLETM